MVIMEEISEAFEQAENINVYNGGVKTVYAAGSDDYKEILACWNKTIEGAHDMPAFGVSINRLTVKELQKNLWVEFDFGKALFCNEIPFEKLLVQVQKEYYGFNLIRYNSDCGYEGRCFYLDLVGKNMNYFYDLLVKF